MKKGKLLITGLAIALTFTAAQGFAWMRGPMLNGQMVDSRYAASLTAEQKTEARKIEAKYQKELADKEAALRTKSMELNNALADGSTTLDKTNGLRAELYALEQEYWQLRSSVNREIGQAIGTTYYGDMGWSPMNCAWHDAHPGMYGGHGNMVGMMGMNRQSGNMYGPGYGSWCRW